MNINTNISIAIYAEEHNFNIKNENEVQKRRYLL